MAQRRGGVTAMSVDKSPTDTYPMRTLRTGDTVQATSMEHAVTILACWLMRPSDVDSYAWWLVLAHLPHNPHHPFAVWNAYDHPERGWSFANGDYCSTVSEATARYEARGGHYELV